MEQARRAGYGVSDGNVAEGVNAVSVAILDARGTPIGSIGIAAIRSRMTQDRIRKLAPLLLDERSEIERAVAG